MSTRKPVRTPDMVCKRLKELHNICGLSFREIALLEEFSPIPSGTLCAIAKGYEIPHRWLPRLGLPAFAPAPVCAKCGEVHVTKRCTKHGPKRELPPHWVDWRLSELRGIFENRYDWGNHDPND